MGRKQAEEGRREGTRVGASVVGLARLIVRLGRVDAVGKVRIAERVDARVLPRAGLWGVRGEKVVARGAGF
jgi:hypothetical protein